MREQAKETIQTLFKDEDGEGFSYLCQQLGFPFQNTPQFKNALKRFILMSPQVFIIDFVKFIRYLDLDVPKVGLLQFAGENLTGFEAATVDELLQYVISE